MNLLDLPDEILFLILKKLNVVQTLDQLEGVHSRLDRILFDDIYVRELDWTTEHWDDSISPMDHFLIDRLCENILPRINEKIVKFTLEPNSIERVLRSVHYPKLSSLSLRNFSRKTLKEHLTKNSCQIQLLNEQITHVDICTIGDQRDNSNHPMDLLEMLLPLSKCLIALTFHQTTVAEDENRLICRTSSTIFSSLTKLNIHLNTFEQCLLLFDGRFPSLSHSTIFVGKIFPTSIDNRINVSQLKYFSFKSYARTNLYDQLILPFLRQMSNLSELHLLLNIFQGERIGVIDGNDLRKNLLIHLSQLKRFHFSIYTDIYRLNKKMSHLSNDDLQQSFIDHQFGQVRSYTHRNSLNEIDGYHVYSMPFQFKEFLRLTSSFTNDLFLSVKTLFIRDHAHWDSHFFNRINQCFPFIQILYIANSSPQMNKSQLNNNVTFNRLSIVNVTYLHIDYIEQMFFNRSIHFPRLYQLEIKYEKLIILTNSFEDDPTKFNCLQLRRLITNESFVRPQNFSKYFPLLE